MNEALGYLPDDNKELDRLLIVENALGEGGLIDRHLRWVETGASPSAGLTDAEYGYRPKIFNQAEDINPKLQRPGREPIDFRKVVTGRLALPYDVPDDILSRKVRTIDSRWYDFACQQAGLSPEQQADMRQSAEDSFSLDLLTEDNLTAYTRVLGRLVVLGEQHGIKVPAVDEWMRGIWPAEEDGHKLSMNEYGQKTGITASRTHIAGRNSQLRAGIDIDPQHVAEFFMYVSWQEFSTHLAHHRNAALLGPAGNALLSHIAADESRHHGVYFGVVKELMSQYPDVIVRTAHAVLMAPHMPGARGIPDFKKRAIAMDRTGVFGREQSHEAAQVVVNKLGLLGDDFDESCLSPQGRQALEELRSLYGQPKTFKQKGAFVLGQTIGVEKLKDLRKQYMPLAKAA